MELEILREIGFTEVETKIYLDLVKHDDSSASEIAKRINISRTYIYDALESLLRKGIISYVLKNNRKRFKPLNFEKLLEFIENKKKFLEDKKKDVSKLINELKKQKPTKTNAPLVEVLEGQEGLKTILNDILRTGKDAVGWGATNKIKNFVPDYIIERYLKERDKKQIKVMQLTSEEEETLKSKYAKYKQIPKEYSSPVTFGKYGDKIVIFFWSEVPVVIRIENDKISKSFQNHFNLLWELCK